MGFSRQECWSGLPFPSAMTQKREIFVGSKSLKGREERVDSSPSNGSRALLTGEGERWKEVQRPTGGEQKRSRGQWVEARHQDGLYLRCQIWSLQECSVIQSCPTLCYPMNCSPPGSSVHGILQARILERVASVWGWLFTHTVVLSQKLHHALNSKQEVIPVTELSAVLIHRVVSEWDLVCISHGLSRLRSWCGRNLAMQHPRKSETLQRLLCSSLIPSWHGVGSQKSEPRLPSWHLKGMDMNSCTYLSLKRKKFQTCLKLEEIWQLVFSMWGLIYWEVPVNENTRDHWPPPHTRENSPTESSRKETSSVAPSTNHESQPPSVSCRNSCGHSHQWLEMKNWSQEASWPAASGWGHTDRPSLGETPSGPSTSVYLNWLRLTSVTKSRSFKNCFPNLLLFSFLKKKKRIFSLSF